MTVAKETIGGVLPIVVGTGTISTAATIEATKHAQSFGADAALVVSYWDEMRGEEEGCERCRGRDE